jgi:putrescine aminotransferase
MTGSAASALTRDVGDDYRRHVSTGRASLAAMIGGRIEVASRGSRIIDQDGGELLDCGGYGVFILGHCHPRVVAAVAEQLHRHPLATRVLLEPRQGAAAAALAEMAPGDLEYVHFVNSGAEATETAIKIARTHGKRRLISAVGGFHGKTMGALSVTARDIYQAPFRPLLPDVRHVPYGDAASMAVALADGSNDCAVILEPVQAEGGVVVPPEGYLREVRDLCRRHDAMLVLDEIQTGLGRLGILWGADREDVVPDVLLVGKALSGGVVPVAAAVATAEAYSALNRDPFLHTSTFAGAPLAMAAAEAALRVIAEEDIVGAAARLGDMIATELRAIVEAECPALVREVRGVGLLIGVEFGADHHAGDFVLELLDRGVIVNHSLNAHRVVRLTPPAKLDESDLQWLFRATRSAAQVLAARYPQHELAEVA